MASVSPSVSECAQYENDAMKDRAMLADECSHVMHHAACNPKLLLLSLSLYPSPTRQANRPLISGARSLLISA